MPFKENLSDLYELGIKEACKAGGAYCERIDEQRFSEPILDRIYNQIAKADFVIAEMTGGNPNVFYEVGYAHALGKATTLLAKTDKDIPFDLRGFRHVIHGGSITKLRDELTSEVKWHIDNLGAKAEDTHVDVLIFSNDRILDKSQCNMCLYQTTYSNIPLTVLNNSNHSFDFSELQIGVILPAGFDILKTTSVSRMPDGNRIHMIQGLSNVLLPGAYHSVFLQIAWTGQKVEPQIQLNKEFEVPVRVFTRNGFRDFSFMAKHTEDREFGNMQQ